MTDKTMICNMALGRVRHNLRVADVDTDTNETAKQLRIYFEPARDTVLEESDWGFARTFAALALTGNTALAGWTYEYQYPDRCIRALKVTDEAGGRVAMRPSYDEEYNDYIAQPWRKIPFARMSRPGSDVQVIATDLPDAYLIYTQKITDTQRWPATFVDAFAWLLAANVGPALKVDTKIATFAMETYMRRIAVAKASTLNEQRPDEPADSPSVSGR